MQNSSPQVLDQNNDDSESEFFDYDAIPIEDYQAAFRTLISKFITNLGVEKDAMSKVVGAAIESTSLIKFEQKYAELTGNDYTSSIAPIELSHLFDFCHGLHLNLVCEQYDIDQGHLHAHYVDNQPDGELTSCLLGITEILSDFDGADGS